MCDKNLDTGQCSCADDKVVDASALKGPGEIVTPAVLVGHEIKEVSIVRIDENAKSAIADYYRRLGEEAEVKRRKKDRVTLFWLRVFWVAILAYALGVIYLANELTKKS